jgi:hypothetical protein
MLWISGEIHKGTVPLLNKSQYFPLLRRGKTTEHLRAVNVLSSHLSLNSSLEATLILKSCMRVVFIQFEVSAVVLK